MNPVDHPHGGGEAQDTWWPPGHALGRADVGYRTRKKRKASDQFIVRGRRRGKKEALADASRLRTLGCRE